jgi:hypothetical protein
MKKLSKEDKAEVKYFQDKMRSVGFVAAAAIVEPQDELSQYHAGFADRLLTFLTRELDDEGKRLINARVKAYALKVSRVKL